MSKAIKETKVVIIGAGPSGLGCAALLKQMGIKDQDMMVLEAQTIGSTFKSWPKEMKMITPSFPSNGFHQTDLNSITPDTSPAFSLGKQHPSGSDYAEYLQNVVNHYDIYVNENQRVTKIQPQNNEESFWVTLENGTVISTWFVIWAGGEFSSPRTNTFTGVELCIHNSQITTWDHLQEDHYAVIGGYESGVDAAFNLAKRGKRVTLIDAATNEPETYDPSRVLSPYSGERLADLAYSDLVELVLDFPVNRVIKTNSGYDIFSRSGEVLSSNGVPINCTGFHTHLGPVQELFSLDNNGFPIVNKFDESTQCQNLFLVGPKLVHDSILLCFIYKFRGRFAMPCSIISDELGLDTSILNHYRQAGMLLNDLSCCEEQQCFC
jgi:thioredoxin reductase